MNITITNKKGVEVNPHMIGLFFEDINYAADGGLYGELLENRSFDFFPTKVFEDIHPLTAWDSVGSVDFESRTDEAMNPINPQYAYVKGAKGSGIVNRAYEGIFAEKGKQYDVSLYAKGNAKLNVSVKNEFATVCNTSFETSGEGWSKYYFTFESTETIYDGKFYVTFDEDGEICLDMLSLFPKDTYNKRKNGMRADLAKALKDMKPGFMRFPGGCIVEGNGLDNRYRWKETIGNIEVRKCNWSRWQDGNVGVLAHDYFQSYGLGFYEYFLLCEDLGCEPLPVLNCGMGCQYQCDEVTDNLASYIQDAIDLIEFANGDPKTNKWAKIRSDMGHEEPFNMQYLGIGNEQWNEKYFERYEKFSAILSRAYPEIKLVTSSGPSASGSEFDNAKQWLSDKDEKFAYIVDEHYYLSSEWMFNNTDRYDSYDRTKTKVFAGEYACHIGDSQPKQNSLEAALAEAAMMTGFERNADVVRLASYAPLFGRIGHSQWTPDMIFFNNHELFLTPSYHVQAMFAQNLPSYTLETEREDDKDVFISAGYEENEGYYVLKVVNKGGQKDIVLTLPTSVTKITEIVLTSNDLSDINTMVEKNKVAPREITREAGSSEISLTAEKYSFNVYKFQ